MQPLVGGGVWPRSLRIALVARTIVTAIYIVLLGLREDCPFKKWGDSGSNFRPQKMKPQREHTQPAQKAAQPCHGLSPASLLSENPQAHPTQTQM